MKFNRVRSDVPLSDADFAAIRRKVMGEVTAVAGRRSPVAAWVFAAAAAAIAIVLFMRPKEDGLKPIPHQPVPHHTTIAQVSPAPPATGDRRPATVRHHRAKRARKPVPQIATRMEIQTADPDVRIIWITR